MKVADYHGYEIYLPTSGGKAGTGNNETSSLQVRKDNCIVKQFRFRVNDSDQPKAVCDKAKNWISGQRGEIGL